jgi:hypothetical protein
MRQKYYKQKQIANTDSKQFEETVENISACPILAKEQCIKKHDSVCDQLHSNIGQQIGVKLDNEHCMGMYQN